MNSNLKETTVVLTRKRMKSPPFPSKQVYKIYFKLTRKKSDLFFCVTSFFFFSFFFAMKKKVHRNVCCPCSLRRMLPIAAYKLAPFRADATFFHSEATLGLPTMFVSPRITVSLRLKRIRTPRLGHHETFQLAAV